MKIPKLSSKIISFILICTAVFLSLFNLDSPSSAPFSEALRSISDGWYWIDDGRVIPVALPCTIQLDNDQDDLVLYNDSLSQADVGLTVSTNGGLYRLQIALGDSVLYRYDDSNFPRNNQMRAKLHCSAVLPTVLTGQPLSLTYQNLGTGIFEVEPVYIGLSGTVFRDYCAREALTLMSILAMGVLSIVAFGISLYLRIARMNVRRFSDAAAFLLLCGTWFILDSALAQYLSGESAVVCYLSFYVFMAIPVPVLYFIIHTDEMGQYPVFRWLIRAFYLNICVQSILDFLGIFTFIEMLWVTHLLFITACLCAPILMMLEYRRTSSKELLTVLIAFVSLILCGLLALAMYWIWGIPYYASIFEFGLLSFVLSLLIYLTVTMANSMHFKAEAEIYKQLSIEDRLTGLANRRSFDEALSVLADNADSYQNAALIFMDMNRLKYINDNFGHTAGDEMIARAARCIEDAFSKQGSCYRIGGDEFAVIMLNPVGCDADWNRWLDRSIERHNQSGQYPLSIARGISLLRDQDQQLKSVSDWKFEADQAMYRYKKQQKQWPFPDN